VTDNAHEMPMTTTEIDDFVYMPEQVIAGFIDTALQMGIKYGQAPHPGFVHVTACTIVLALARHGWPIQTQSTVTALCRASNHAPCPGRCDVQGHEWTCGCECHSSTRARPERNVLAEAFIRGLERGANEPDIAGDGEAMYQAFRDWIDLVDNGHE
jgi:hypothetical protein